MLVGLLDHYAYHLANFAVGVSPERRVGQHSLSIAAIFVAQATNTPVTGFEQMTVLGALMLASKGSAGVAGAGFVTLAATLAAMHSIPVSGLVLLLGVDRFMAEASR